MSVTDDCPFCARIRHGVFALAADLAVAIADTRPLTPGHHLVLSRRHEPDFFSLRSDEVDALLRVTFELQARLSTQLQADGFNVGVNIGEAGGQTIPHVHVHLIPRYLGDVPDPRGGIRWIIPDRAPYWEPITPAE
jgi:diadenosine tetraphosphate (Ap4A) HIT family hydrolase